MLENKKKTESERHKHADYIGDTYVHKLLEPFEHKDIEELPIYDLVILKNHAEYAYKNRIFSELKNNPTAESMFCDNISWVTELLVSKITDAESLYIIYDTITQLPFINDEDCLEVFSVKEYADDMMEIYEDRFKNFYLVKTQKDDIVPVLSRAFYINGAKGILIDGGDFHVTIDRDWLISIPDEKDKIREFMFVNPDFCLAFIKFWEEQWWPVSYEGREEILRSKEQAMRDEFCKARFLVPTIKNVTSGKPHNDIMLVKDKNGKFFVPVFTDWVSYDEMIDGVHNTMARRPEELLKLPFDVIVNPKTFKFMLNKEQLRSLIYGKQVS